MIRRVRIRNFQSLRDVELQASRFTVITGPSDVGKSAVIRAIDALLSNRVGQDFITHGTNQAVVAIEFDGGAYVAWVKTGGTAQYKVRLPGSAQVKTFDKVGRNVPAEVAAVTKIGPTTVGGQAFSPNIHRQFDLPFIVVETPLVRARILGEISGVNVIAYAVTESGRREAVAKQLQGVRLSDFEKAKEQLQGMQYLAITKQRLTEANVAVSDTESAVSEVDQLESDISSLEQAEHLIASINLASIASATKQVDAAIKAFNDLDKQTSDIDSLVTRMQSTQQSLDALQTVSAKASSAIQSLEKDILLGEKCPMCGQPLLQGKQ